MLGEGGVEENGDNIFANPSTLQFEVDPDRVVNIGGGAWSWPVGIIVFSDLIAMIYTFNASVNNNVYYNNINININRDLRFELFQRH